jgi:hypothetical protein
MNGSILIPEKFKLNGKTIEVIIDNDYCQQENLLGEADFTDKIITLCDRFNGLKLSKNNKEKIYYHELVHMILDAMGKDVLKFDEDFVDRFSLLLWEFEKSKR